MNGEREVVDRLFDLKRHQPERLHFYFHFPLEGKANRRYSCFNRVYGERAFSEIERRRKIGCLNGVSKSDVDFYRENIEPMIRAIYLEVERESI